MRYFIYLAIVTLLFSCRITKEKCQERYPPQVIENTTHTIETIRKDSLLPGATIEHTFVKDSLIFIPEYKIFTIRDTSGLAELRYYKDAYGNIIAQCEATDRMVENIKQFYKSEKSTNSTHVNTEYRTPVWVWIVFGIMITVIVYLLIRKSLRL